MGTKARLERLPFGTTVGQIDDTRGNFCRSRVRRDGYCQLLFLRVQWLPRGLLMLVPRYSLQKRRPLLRSAAKCDDATRHRERGNRG